LSQETRTEIRALVQSVIDLLGSPAVAIDERHGPKLYSRFLEKLLAKPMAKLDPTSPGLSTGPLPTSARVKPKRTKSSNGQNAQEPPNSGSYSTDGFEIPSTVYSHPSPSTSHSLSPPVTSAALSFDQFAPVGAIDPFAPNGLSMNTAAEGLGLGMSGEFFNPPLPFDPEIMQSYQSLTDPNEWNDVSFPPQFADLGSNWMSQFEQNVDGIYAQPSYMTGGAMK
jgi:hypothetical protein